MPSSLNGLNIVHPPANFDSQDLLSYPDLSAQLDLWTNLPFDETLQKTEDDEDEHAEKSSAPQQPSFDLAAFLAGLGADSYARPPAQPQSTASLAQLLALHSVQQQNINSNNKSTTKDSPAPAKRARTRKASVDGDDVGDANSTPLSAAEDKRRRNTAASARFRLKKKEREAALETKAKELESRVNELERECEALRRENGWLKGLVVGVTQSGKRQREDETDL